MNIAEIGQQAAAYVERGWTQNYAAVNTSAYPIEPNGPEAVAWCAYGALCAVVDSTVDEPSDELEEITSHLASLLPATVHSASKFMENSHNADVHVVASWNDAGGRTAGEVAAVLRSLA